MFRTTARTIALAGAGTALAATGVLAGSGIANAAADSPAPSHSASAQSGDRDAKAQKVIDYAKKQLGTPYDKGANGGDAIDCSGLTKNAYKQVGEDLPRVSHEQADAYPTVSRDEAKPGDLVSLKEDGENVNHVGIYEGDGKVIHASGSRGKVIEENVDNWVSSNTQFHRVF